MPDRWACESVIMGIMVQEKAFQVRRYGVIAFTPSTPAMAVATVTITFRMVFRVSLLIFMMFVFLVLSVRSRRCSRGAGLPELQFRTCALSGRLAGRLLRPGRGTERWLIKKIRVCCVCVCRRPTVRGSRRSMDIAWPTRQAPPCRCRRGRG